MYMPYSDIVMAMVTVSVSPRRAAFWLQDIVLVALNRIELSDLLSPSSSRRESCNVPIYGEDVWRESQCDTTCSIDCI